METELLEIVTPETAGDPMGQRKWVAVVCASCVSGLAQVGVCGERADRQPPAETARLRAAR